MFDYLKTIGEKVEFEELDAALAVFQTAHDKLQSLRNRIQVNYQKHNEDIQDLENKKRLLSDVDMKAHNILVKLKEFV